MNAKASGTGRAWRRRRWRRSATGWSSASAPAGPRPRSSAPWGRGSEQGLTRPGRPDVRWRRPTWPTELGIPLTTPDEVGVDRRRLRRRRRGRPQPRPHQGAGRRPGPREDRRHGLQAPGHPGDSREAGRGPRRPGHPAGRGRIEPGRGTRSTAPQSPRPERRSSARSAIGPSSPTTAIRSSTATSSAIADPAALDRAILAIPGVVGTGLFLGMADVVLVQEGESVRSPRAGLIRALDTLSKGATTCNSA